MFLSTTTKQVLCEVVSVHWDRLDVKVAVRYPKSYGPYAGGVRNRQASVEDEEDQIEVQDVHFCPTGYPRGCHLATETCIRYFMVYRVTRPVLRITLGKEKAD